MAVAKGVPTHNRWFRLALGTQAFFEPGTSILRVLVEFQ